MQSTFAAGDLTVTLIIGPSTPPGPAPRAFVVGEEIPIRAVFSAAATGVAFSVRRPDGTSFDVAAGAVGNDAGLKWWAAQVPDSAGTWAFQVRGGSPLNTYGELAVRVRHSLLDGADETPPVEAPDGWVRRVAGRYGDVALTTDDIWLGAAPTDTSAVLQAVGDGSANAVAALEATLAAVSYDCAYVPAGTYLTTFAQAFQYPGRWALGSPGIAKIGGAQLPFGDIRSSLTIAAGYGTVFTSINDALAYLHDRRIRPNAVATIQVADGVYTPNSLLFFHPDGGRVRLLGNQTTPASCQLTFDATANQSGIAVLPGFALGLVDGFKVVGNGARVNRTTWNAACYGAGVLANSATMFVGGKMLVDGFYYGFLADKRGCMRISPGAAVSNSGDVAFHARELSEMLCDGCSAATGAHFSASVSLGSGAAAELGSAMSCQGFTASDFQVAGINSSGNSSVWAQGAVSTGNLLYGAVSFGGYLDLGYSNTQAAATRMNGNGIGVAVFNGGYVTMQHPAGSPAQINGNTYDGINVDGAGRGFYGTYIGQSGNGGYGARAANAGQVRVLNSTLAGGSGASITDSGRGSLVLTS